MSLLVLAIEKPYWQDVLIKAAELGETISAAVVQYRDVGAPNHFFDLHKPKQIDGKAFYQLGSLSKLITKDFGSDFPPLDLQILNAFEPIERDFYLLTDRFSYFPKTFTYRKRLFREALRYWLAFFQHNKITGVFVGCTPHNLSDYTCFHAARYLGIPTLLVGHTMINDYLIMRGDYREADKVPADYMAGANDEELKASISLQLYNEAFADSEVLKYVIRKNDQSVGAKNIKPEKEKIDYAVVRKQLKRYLWNAPKFKAALAMNGVYPTFVRRGIKHKNYFEYKLRRKEHDSLAVVPDLNAKFVYFAMHLQPERTSTPEAELFEDHLLAIDILAKALPPGWKLYVKENPRQYNKINFIKGKHQRDITDYQEFLKLPNVQLISQQVPSRELLQKAQGVSTLSGSVGWEALRAGKPCIIFANAWYSACESALRVESVAEAKAAIEYCRNSTPQKVHTNLLRYLSYMQNKLCVGSMGDPSDLGVAKVPYEKLVQFVAERIIKALPPAA